MAENDNDGALAVARNKYQIDVKHLSVVDNVFSVDQLQLLHDKTPADHIHHLPANAGAKGGLPYVTGGYIKHMLTRLTGGAWNFEVKEKGVVDGEIWILGRLTLIINGREISKEQFGGATIKKLKSGTGNVNLANDMKAAATDALKKCASEFGIAGDVYNANEFIDAKILDESGKDIEDEPVTEPAGEPKTQSGTNERLDPATLVTPDYKRETERMLTAAHLGSADRVKFIKTVTDKMSTNTLSLVHWMWLREALEAESKGEVIK